MFRNGATRLLLATHARHHSHAHTIRVGHIAEHVAILRIVPCAEAEVNIVQEPFPFALLACDTPLFHVIVRPVAVVHEHFGLHVVHVVVDINLVGNFLIVGVTRKFVTLEPLNHRLVIGRRTGRSIVISINQVDIRSIETVLGFVIVFVVAFTQIMDTVILAIVIYNNVTSTLVIYAQAFCHRSSDAVAYIVIATVVTKIAERERLEFLEFRIVWEQRVLEALIAVFFTQSHRERLLFFRAAILSRNLVVAHHAECRSFRRARFEQFHIHGKFTIAPEIRTLLRIHHRSSVTCHIQARIGAEHRKRIGRYEQSSNRRLAFKNIGANDFFARIGPHGIGTAAKHRSRIDRQVLLHRR